MTFGCSLGVVNDGISLSVSSPWGIVSPDLDENAVCSCVVMMIAPIGVELIVLFVVGMASSVDIEVLILFLVEMLVGCSFDELDAVAVSGGPVLCLVEVGCFGRRPSEKGDRIG